MATRGQPVYNVYPLANYTFGNKQPKLEKDGSVQDRLARLRNSYEQHGMRRSVEAILVVQEHNTPHVLLLQLGLNHFKLPGGRLRPGEEEVEGLRRKLTSGLAPANPSLHVSWDVGEVVGVFYRPNFDTVFYPYVPPHITRPKESRKLFVVQLPERAVFAVPKNMRLVAVPLFDLYDNLPRYGPVITSVPAVLSRLRLNLQFVLPAPPPHGGQQQGQQGQHGQGGYGQHGQQQQHGEGGHYPP
ncbi:hypothetical protein HYH02_005494 [Chlamydomonas schloesseri]|uniref:Cleavage and polyadenylation specificity factor subunit 5 n=1 Tax=Chlamydomonas schloesseri TaxID=2026947 RepID=A0A835WKG2_9CHLO|nr:hypothetical protein HYH02_005494 [Chlamydomonas schloesseri]|eukprot:KAG2449339.1 hypothetical protein HYH02_005494 [Chlamydomonas schloesseri]